MKHYQMRIVLIVSDTGNYLVIY